MTNELDKLVDNALKRLQGDDATAGVITLQNWYLVEKDSPSFENAMVIVGLRDNGDGWQTGFISDCDFSTGDVMEVSGQKYKLGRVNELYLQALYEHSPDFAEIAEKLGSDVDS